MNKEAMIRDLDFKTFDELSPEQQYIAWQTQLNAALEHINTYGGTRFSEGSEEFEAVKRAIAKAEANKTPWFFIEMLLDEKCGDRTMRDVLQEEVKATAEATLYCNGAHRICIL